MTHPILLLMVQTCKHDLSLTVTKEVQQFEHDTDSEIRKVFKSFEVTDLRSCGSELLPPSFLALHGFHYYSLSLFFERNVFRFLLLVLLFRFKCFEVVCKGEQILEARDAMMPLNEIFRCYFDELYSV